MFTTGRGTSVGRLAVGIVMAAAVAQGAPGAIDAKAVSPRDLATLRQAYGSLPLNFEANHGQTDPEVRFTTRGQGARVFLTQTGATFVLRSDRQGSAVRMMLTGARANARITGENELPGRSHYFIGDDPTKWRTDVTTYAKVRYHEPYPGIDLVYYGNQRQLEYDFIVAPGVDPSRIQLAFEGADRLEIDDNGDLVLTTAVGEIRQHKPVIYQNIDGKRVEVAGGYHLSIPDPRSPITGAARVSFSVSSYDARLPLVIDPTLAYSTYLGGTGTDSGEGIAVDSSGAAYVTGFTGSSDFPTTVGAFDASLSSTDAFVSKLNAADTSIVYSTFLGGSGVDQELGLGVAVDGAGAACITGFTSSSDFPTTTGAFDTSFNASGASDGFVTKLNATGNALVYSTYLGGDDLDRGLAIAVDVTGSAYITGRTQSSDFPTAGGAFDTLFNGNQDVFVTKLNAAGTALDYSTFLGGNLDEQGFGIAVDASGAAYVTGFTTSSANFPTTSGAFDTTFNGGALDVFVTKLNGTGGLVYSAFLGGSGDESGLQVAVDSANAAYVTGETSSIDFPTNGPGGAYDPSLNGGGQDAFVTKVNAAGDALAYSTYLGGAGADVGEGIAVFGDTAYVSGFTQSVDFPTTVGAFDTTLSGRDVFLTKFNAAGTAPVYSTYLGGSGSDVNRALALDGTGAAYVTGSTGSADFPTTAGAFDTSANGNSDVFVSKFGTHVTASPASLFPSDRRMVRVTLAAATTPPGLPCTIVSVVPNQTPRGVGPDVVFIGPLTVDLRAERPSGGQNRKYVVNVSCVDGIGIGGNVEVQVLGVR